MARPAPAPRGKPKRSSLMPFYVILGVVALGGAFMLFRQAGGGGGSPATTLEPVTLTPEQLQRVPGISKGDPNAPVVILEFADFQCPGCGQFARFSEPLLNEWIENGTVRFVWYDYPLVQPHKNAVLAARAGRCANEQNRFWPFHDMVFGGQAEWSESDDAADIFIRYAEATGIERGAFSQCLRSGKYQDVVSQSFQLGTTLGVSGTPTLFINGKKVNDTPSRIDEWRELITQELGAARPAGAGVPGAPAAGTAAPAAAPADSAGA